jgi:ADP-ribosyl-[dinitrogen reductase] hydrolase
LLQLIEALPHPWRAAVTGAILGDALGVPHEFKAGHSVPPFQAIEMVMSSGYAKTYETIPYGTGSDDSAQLLAFLDTLCERQGVYDHELFLANLLAWLNEGKYQAGGVVFDVGGQTLRALEERRKALPLTGILSGRCGNGSLMRTLPAAVLPDCFGVSHDQAILIAMAQSDVTHPQPLARVSCALYVELCWLVRGGRIDFRAVLKDAGEVLLNRHILSGEERDSVAYVLAYGAGHLPTGSGYVVNSLWSALWALERSKSLSDALRHSIGFGEDTDTIACIAGGIGGIAFGMDDACRAWEDQLVQYDVR